MFVVLEATAIALLATLMASPEITRLLAENAYNEPFARTMLTVISILRRDPGVIFLVEFILSLE